MSFATIATLMHWGAADPTIEQWGQWEQTWAGPAAGDNGHGNPFVDVTLFVELSPPTASTAGTVVRGFYDGAGRFTARFMPPTTGVWRYKTRSSTTPALDGKAGTFTVVAANTGIEGGDDDGGAGRGAGSVAANRGPVRAAGPNSTKFAHADGTPFFAVATTVYGMFINSSKTLETLVPPPPPRITIISVIRSGDEVEGGSGGGSHYRHV